MKIKVGVMGSAGGGPEDGEALRALAQGLGRAFAARGCVLLNGAAVVFDEDPGRLLVRCLEALGEGRIKMGWRGASG
jgi:hypothetical protein